MFIADITAANRSDALVAQLAEVWERSVRATHTFLTEDGITELRPVVPEALRGVEHLSVAFDGGDEPSVDGLSKGISETSAALADGNVLCDTAIPVGFMGVDGDRLEMLFLDLSARGHGLGRRLLTHAIEKLGVVELTVNEQNPAARGFYEHMGFRVVSRSPVDDAGRPYPLLTMRLDGWRLGRVSVCRT